MNKVILNGVDLSIEDVVNVARNGYQVEIDKDCMAHIAEVRNYMESEWMRDDAPAVYGFNTGLGKHKDHKVTIEESDLHQYRTVLSYRRPARAASRCRAVSRRSASPATRRPKTKRQPEPAAR